MPYKLLQLALCAIPLLTAQLLMGTQESVIFIPQPLDINGEIVIMDTPVLIGEASPETDFSAITLPYMLKALSYREVSSTNINQASLANVTIVGSALSPDHYLITFDLAKAAPKYIQRSLFLQLIECCTRISHDYDVSTLSFEVINTEAHPDAIATLNEANIFFHRFHNDSETWRSLSLDSELEKTDESREEEIAP